jgi:hypothetical protein
MVLAPANSFNPSQKNSDWFGYLPLTGVLDQMPELQTLASRLLALFEMKINDQVRQRLNI